MMFVTGDCHGDYRRFNRECFPEQREMGKEDFVVVCGDFGFWSDSKEQRYWMDWLEGRPFTTLWVDGNHENYDLLGTVEVKTWHGGKVQFIRPSVIHLMRGQVYDLNGLSCFTFGGAASHDIDGGVLERSDPAFRQKKLRLTRQHISYRVNHETWWKEEMPSEEEMEEGRKNLESCGWKVDYIFTHCCASGTQAVAGMGLYKADALTDYLEELRGKCAFQKWFFGHYHGNRNMNEKELMLYEQIVQIQ